MNDRLVGRIVKHGRFPHVALAAETARAVAAGEHGHHQDDHGHREAGVEDGGVVHDNLVAVGADAARYSVAPDGQEHARDEQEPKQHAQDGNPAVGFGALKMRLLRTAKPHALVCAEI